MKFILNDKRMPFFANGLAEFLIWIRLTIIRRIFFFNPILCSFPNIYEKLIQSFSNESSILMFLKIFTTKSDSHWALNSFGLVAYIQITLKAVVPVLSMKLTFNLITGRTYFRVFVIYTGANHFHSIGKKEVPFGQLLFKSIYFMK